MADNSIPSSEGANPYHIIVNTEVQNCYPYTALCTQRIEAAQRITVGGAQPPAATCAECVSRFEQLSLKGQVTYYYLVEDRGAGAVDPLVLELEYSDEPTQAASDVLHNFNFSVGSAFNVEDGLNEATQTALASCSCGEWSEEREFPATVSEASMKLGLTHGFQMHMRAVQDAGGKSKKEQILAIYESGVTDIAQICRLVAARPSYVAQVLQREGLITGFFDLYTTTAREQNVYSRFFRNVLAFKTVDASRESVKKIDRLFNYFERLGDRAGSHQAMVLALVGANRARWADYEVTSWRWYEHLALAFCRTYYRMEHEGGAQFVVAVKYLFGRPYILSVTEQDTAEGKPTYAKHQKDARRGDGQDARGNGKARAGG